MCLRRSELWAAATWEGWAVRAPHLVEDGQADGPLPIDDVDGAVAAVQHKRAAPGEGVRRGRRQHCHWIHVPPKAVLAAPLLWPAQAATPERKWALCEHVSAIFLL